MEKEPQYRPRRCLLWPPLRVPGHRFASCVEDLLDVVGFAKAQHYGTDLRRMVLVDLRWIVLVTVLSKSLNPGYNQCRLGLPLEF
uniref:Uncharacterized protein n=1 Tax=Oryza punctata TaxID=4537 RepID=A0A0E0MMA2_ORYPU